MLEEIPDLIGLSVPFFIFFILVEIGIGLWKKRLQYRFNDTISNLGAGMLQTLVGLFTRLSLLAVFHQIYQQMSLPFFESLNEVHPALKWTVAFLLVDMLYYWFHRSSHRVNLIWASHVPHHSSDEYNLSVALRQGAFQGFFSFPFYLPLAFLGLDVLTFAILSQVTTIYQFWIHTRWIDRMWLPVELIFNTPTHHRVHHGRNPQYIDKNHAGTLIIWDKLFGTFEPEVDEVKYGITEPLNSWSPIECQSHHFQYLLSNIRSAPKTKDWIRLLFKGPEYAPAWVTKTNHGKRLTTDINAYRIITSFLFVTALGLEYWLINQKETPAALNWGIAGVVLFLLILVGVNHSRQIKAD